MTKQDIDTLRPFERGREHAEMLEAALARPGVREIMKVHGVWQEKDRGLGAWRSAAKEAWNTITTDSSNPR